MNPSPKSLCCGTTTQWYARRKFPSTLTRWGRRSPPTFSLFPTRPPLEVGTVFISAAHTTAAPHSAYDWWSLGFPEGRRVAALDNRTRPVDNIPPITFISVFLFFFRAYYMSIGIIDGGRVNCVFWIQFSFFSHRDLADVVTMIVSGAIRRFLWLRLDGLFADCNINFGHAGNWFRANIWAHWYCLCLWKWIKARSWTVPYVIDNTKPHQISSKLRKTHSRRTLHNIATVYAGAHVYSNI